MSDKARKIAALVPAAEEEYKSLTARMKKLRDRWEALHDGIKDQLSEIRRLEEEMDQLKPLISATAKLVPEEKRS